MNLCDFLSESFCNLGRQQLPPDKTLVIGGGFKNGRRAEIVRSGHCEDVNDPESDYEESRHYGRWENIVSILYIRNVNVMWFYINIWHCLICIVISHVTRPTAACQVCCGYLSRVSFYLTITSHWCTRSQRSPFFWYQLPQVMVQNWHERPPSLCSSSCSIARATREDEPRPSGFSLFQPPN